MITLVLLPGMDGTATLFAPFIQALGAEFKIKCVAYPNDQSMNYAELTAYVRGQLPCDTPYVLLGESFSGPIAITLASEHALHRSAGQLLGLILCCTFVRNPRPALSGLSRLADALLIFRPPTTLLSALLLGQYATSVLRRLLTNAVAQVSPQVMRGRLAAVMRVDVTGQLSVVNLPVLSMSARQDRLVPQAASQLICDLNTLVHNVQLDGPHCLLQAQPVRAASEVIAFIQGLEDLLPVVDD